MAETMGIGPTEQDEYADQGRPVMATVRKLLGQILIHFRLAVTVFVICAACGFLFISMLPVVYSTEAILYLNYRNGQLSGQQLASGTDGAHLADVKSEVEIIQTRGIALKVVRQLRLTEDPEFQPRQSILKRIVRPTKRIVTSEQKEIFAAQTLMKKLRVVNDPDSYIIRLRYSDSDPERAAQLVNAVIDAYVLDYQGNPQRTNRDAVAWIDDYIATLKKRIAEAGKAVDAQRAKQGQANGQSAAHVNQEIDAITLLLSKATRAREKAEAALGTDYQGSVSPSQEVRSARAREAELRARLTSAREQLARLSQAESGTAALDEEARASQKLMSELMRRARIADMKLGSKRPGAEVVSRATIPIAPVSPKLKVLVPLALLLSVAASIAACWTAAIIQTKFRSMGQAARAGLNVIGAVPYVPARDSNSPFTASSRSSGFWEAIRWSSLAMRIDGKQDSCHVVLVAAPRKGDGCSTISSGLATSLHHAGYRCLLVDGNFQNPTLHTVFDVKGSIGFADVLAGDQTIAKTVSIADDRPAILPAGDYHGGLLDVMTPRRLAKAFDQLRQNFDFIIIDSSPVLEGPGAALMAAHADHILVALKWNASDQLAASQCCRILQQCSDRDPQVILTQVDYSRMSRFEEGRSEHQLPNMLPSRHEQKAPPPDARRPAGYGNLVNLNAPQPEFVKFATIGATPEKQKNPAKKERRSNGRNKPATRRKKSPSTRQGTTH